VQLLFAGAKKQRKSFIILTRLHALYFNTERLQLNLSGRQ